MKKITYLLSLLFIFASTAMAQTLVTDAQTELTDGVKIALQCRDNNGGPGWLFNANTAKTPQLSASTIFVVVGNATDGFKLKRVSDDMYITRINTDALGVSENESEGVSFTAQSFGDGNFNISSSTEQPGTVKANYVRFTNNGSYLNTQAQNGTPKFASGTGGYSAWYVYKFTDDEVNAPKEQVNVTVKHVCNEVTLSTVASGYEMSGTDYPVTPVSRLGLVPPSERTFTVQPDKTEYTVNYTYDATALPFTTTKKYNLFILRSPKKRVTYNPESKKCENAGTAISGEDVAKFYFEGDNVSGFTIKNVAAGSSMVLGGTVGNNAILTFSETNTDKFVLENNSGHKVFRNAAGSNGYLNDVNDEIGYWTAGAASTDDGGSFEFVEIPDEAVNVTYHYYYKDRSKLYTTTTGIVDDGDFTAPKVKWLKNLSQETVDNADNSKTVHVICENGDDLPFTPSETFDAVTDWYLMDVHSNESTYVVYADDDENVRVVDYGRDPAYPSISTGEGYENEQWCFVGNVYDGFKVYSKVVGGEKSLYQPSDADVEITLSADGQGFRLGDTNGQVDGFTLRINGRSYYINHRKTKLQGWIENDGGSSFRFFRVTKTLTEADDVKHYLDEIGGRFPTQESDNVTWPSEYRDAGIDDFDLLTKALQALDEKDNTALADYSNKLKSLIDLSNAHGYPISYLLTYPANEYGTAYVPFNTEKPEGLTLYTCEEVDGDKLTLVEGGDFRANTAVIVKAEEAVRGTTRQFIGYGNQKSETQANAGSLLKGTHDGCVAPQGSYVLQKHDDVLGFYLVDGTVDVNVPAGRCYLEWPAGQGVNRLVFPEGTTTAIDTVLGTQSGNASIYDLAGRRVKNATKGIYIIGGKKVVVK